WGCKPRGQAAGRPPRDAPTPGRRRAGPSGSRCLMSQNHVRAFLNFALRVYEEALQHAGGADGGGPRPSLPEWGPAFQQGERELKDLYAAALRQAERTGFPVPEVERRLRNLQTHILAVLLWPRDAPPLSSEELRSRELSGCWSGGPVSDYLSEHGRRMMDA